MQNNEVYLHNITTCVPEKSYSQDFALDFMLKLQGDTEKKRSFLKRLYKGTAINKRHTVIDDYDKEPAEFQFYPKNHDFKPEPSTKKRNDLYIKESNRLSLKASEDLFSQLDNFDTDKITHLITISCTGFSAPGFDLYLCKKLNLNPSVTRYHIGFMGCYAAFTGMKLARTICLAEKNAKVLMINVELCSLHFQHVFDLDIVVANSIFSDGISAALITNDINDSSGSKILLKNFFSQYVEDSEDDMAWRIGDHGFDMKLSVYVPKIIEQNINTYMQFLFRQAGLEKKDIDIWAIHPGGSAILRKIESVLAISPQDLSISYSVLKEFGNMSSTTIMFVLQRIMANTVFGNIFAVAFGPGLTIETGYLKKIQ